MIDPEFVKTKYNGRNTDIENTMDEKTQVKIFIHIGDETNLNMQSVVEKNISELEKLFPETYLNIIHFGNDKIKTFLEEKNIKFFVRFPRRNCSKP